MTADIKKLIIMDSSQLAHHLAKMPASTKTKRKKGKISREQCLKEGVCPECLRELPPPVREDRGEGHSELITYCPCGATFTGGI